MGKDKIIIICLACAHPENFLRDGPASGQGWSNKFYHCKNPFYGTAHVWVKKRRCMYIKRQTYNTIIYEQIVGT